jgi:hypothetical protein
MHSTPCNYGTLYWSASAIRKILFSYQDFERAQNTLQDTRYVHVVDILWNNNKIVKLLTYDAEPVQHFIVDIVIVSCPV